MPFVTDLDNFPFHSRDKSVWYYVTSKNKKITLYLGQ